MAAEIRKIGDPENESERKAIKYLSEKLPDDYILFHNLELKLPSDKSSGLEYDIIIIGEYAVYVIEVKGWKGGIEGNAREWKLPSGATHPSPIRQTTNKARVLKSILCESGLQIERKLWVQPMVVITDNFVNLKLEDNQKHLAMTLENAIGFILDPNNLDVRYPVRSIVNLKDVISEKIHNQFRYLRREHEIREYKIINTLETNNLYKTVLAVNREIPKRRVMLKIYDFDVYAAKRDQQREKERIKRDVEALSELEGHSNFARAYNFFPWENKFISATEWVDGYSLRGLLESDESFDLNRKMKIMSQLCEGLNYAHTHGVIHRNVNPDNIIIPHQGTVKLINFDCARIVDIQTITPELKRLFDKQLLDLDERYFAPEIFHNFSTASKASDIYSLGIVFFELLTGKLPYQEIKEALVSKKLPHLPSEIRPDIPNIAELDMIINKMCAFFPEDRYDSLTQVIIGLNKVKKAFH